MNCKPKRFIALTLLCTFLAPALQAEIYSGTCGSNLTWQVNTEDSTITISGTGVMSFSTTPPWLEKGLADRIAHAVVQEGVTQIGQYSFIYHENLRDISLPSTLVAIGNDAFFGCRLDSVNLPDNLLSIGEGAFLNNNLRSVKLPARLRSLGSDAFKECRLLERVTFSNSLAAIRPRTFQYCSRLDSIILPESVTIVADEAFAGCAMLSYVEAGSKLDSIGYLAFNGTRISMFRLAALTPPRINRLHGLGNVVRIPSEAIEAYLRTPFWAGEDLLAITGEVVSQDLAWWLNPDDSTLTFKGRGVMPKTISNMYARWHCGGNCNADVAHVVFSDSLTSIPASLCSGMYNLCSIKWPQYLTEIGDNAFKDCTRLSTVTLPDSLTTIGRNVFHGTFVNNLTIPRHVKFIGRELLSFPQIGGSYSITWEPDSIGDFDNSDYNRRSPFANISQQVKHFTLGNHVRYVPSDLFYMLMIDSLHVPASVQSLPFGKKEDYMLRLRHISVDAANDTYSSADGLLLDKSANRLVKYPSAKEDSSFTLPANISSIAPFAMTELTNLQELRVLASTPPELERANLGMCRVYVPLGSLSAYQKHSYWNQNILHVHRWQAEVETSPSIAIINLNHAADIDSCYFMGMKATGVVHTLKGLVPDTTYRLVLDLITTAADHDTMCVAFTTLPLALETQAARATSNSCAVIAALTNLSDQETSCGFEWRRYDAPNLVPSTEVMCPVQNGAMTGRLQGLSANTYYKYRPFYKSMSGKYYYGEWTAFGTADAYVYFEPTVYTYAAQNVQRRSARLRGYAMAGSDDFTEQGFELWTESRVGGAANTPRRVPGNVRVITATGMNMQADLTDLDEGTVYRYRTYVKTANETRYGTEQSFTTQGTFMVTIGATCNAEHGTVEGAGTYAYGTSFTLTATPTDGYRFVRWSDGVTDNPRTVTAEESLTFTAEFEPVGSGLEEARIAGISFAEGMVQNHMKLPLHIYDAAGRLIYQGSDERIELPARGVYLIRSRLTALKVAW